MAGTSKVNLRNAREAWKCLSGLFCIYKPPRASMAEVTNVIRGNLTRDLNSMSNPLPQHRIEIVGSVAADELSIEKLPDYSTHPRVMGPYYQHFDHLLHFGNELFPHTSGVCPVGIGVAGKGLISALQDNQVTATYQLEGKLGVSTLDNMYTGVPVEKSSYEHVTKSRLERVLYSLQSSHQRKMLDQLGLPPNSQAAYEALSAAEGLVRPSKTIEPILYGIKLLDFGSPHFRIEVTGVNIAEHYPAELINNIGLKLKTNAHALKIRCLRYGPFSVDDSLIRKHWNLENIINNIALLKPLASDAECETVTLRKVDDYVEQQRKITEEKMLQIESKKRIDEKIGIKMLKQFEQEKKRY